MFQFHANNAGCEFKSDILCTAPYNRMSMFCQTTREGQNCEEHVDFVEGNEPLKTLIEHLEDLKNTFCGTDYFFNGNCLVFDDVDKIRDANSNQLCDINDLDITPTFSMTTEENFASARFQFCEDATETQGNKHTRDSSCLLYTSPSTRDATLSPMPSSA